MPAGEQQSGPVPAKPDQPRRDNAFSATVIRPEESALQSGADSERIMGISTGPATAAQASPESSDRASAQPAAFGRYAVLRALGAGSFGAVYLGHDGQLDRAVAIKVLHSSRASSAAEYDQFLHEARKLAQLRHPGIVAVHDVGVHDGQVYVVSDYLDGPDLGRWLAENRFKWPEAVRIAAAVADALAHAHERLIVHRDVKPANIIMVTADRAPVLVDFGIALDDARAGGQEQGVLCGTPCYMSPEQASGAAHRIDGRMDIYSLGVVLYELLTGRVPFRSANFAELLRQIRDDEPQPLRQLVRDIPPDLERICLKALAKRQQDRYGTAVDFAEELRLVLATATASAFQHQMPAIQAPATELASIRSTAQLSTSSRRRAREAEHRQVTVVVCGCDLFESDGYLQLDAEQQVAVLRSFQQACQHALFELDGTVVQCSEQGLLACFGYPVAHEDGAQRAVRSGMGILSAMHDLSGKLRREHNLELNPRIGVHTGPAVVEAKDDAILLVGEARNVAFRLGDVAAPGHMICTEATHRLLRGRFLCASLGHQKIKGVPQPVQLFQVQAIAATASTLAPRQSGGLSPLTGRDHEISLLKDRWEQAQEGMGQVVLLIGEPGLGKSRLVHTLKEQVLGEMVEGELDAPVIEWRCSPHYQNTGLYPAIDFYERALGLSREEPPQARFDRLLHRLEQYGLARPDTVPLWASLLSLPTPDRFPPLSLSPIRQREETFRAMLEWLHTRSARKPVLFVVEDLHWMDASTLEFLGQFLAEGLHASVLTVLTFRPEFKTPWPALEHQTSLALNRLTRRQVGELMRQTTQGSVSDAVIERIYDRAGGVPLFVEEFSKMAQESGLMDQTADEPTAQAELRHEIPATLQDLIMARVDRMEGERDLAQLAAVLGREFNFDLLAAVANVDEPTLQAQLAALAKAEIVYAKGRPPRCVYIFKHALLEDALYNALVKSRRQQFHARIGETLETQFPQTAETQPELLGHHFTEAGQIGKAVGYWLKAGLRSRDRSADREAIGHLTKGLALLATLDETPERDVQELQFLTTLGPTYIAVRGYAAPEVGPVLARARELCERTGDPQQLLGIMLGIWEWRIVRGDLRLCVGLAAEGRALAERMNDAGMLMEALFMSGTTHFYRGEFAAARSCLEYAVATYDDRERTRFWTAFTNHNAGITHRCYLALSLWHLGFPDQALGVDRETRELARTIGHAFSLGHAIDFTAFLCQCCRLGAEVQAAGEEEISLAAEQGFQLWHALGTIHKGAGLLLQGRHEEGLPLFVKGLSAFQATGAEVRVPSYLCMLGDECIRAGRFDEARKALQDGLVVSEKNDDRSHDAELHRLTGRLLLAESPDQSAGAEECFHRAIETARRQQSKAWELRATMSLVALWQDQGRRSEARAALAAIYDTYTEGFTTPDLVDAKDLLAALQ
jgi:serine/threonine protein kinase/predicted ATPase